MFTLIENGEVYGPEPLGLASVLLVDSTILKIGDVDRVALDRLGLPVEVIDASRCIVTPGIIDPHQHLLGGSGEEGSSSQNPEISAGEIVSAGITTVVGCLEPGQLTLSSDAGQTSPANLLEQIRRCKEHGCIELPQLLALVTKNTATVLKLESKGELAAGKDADVLVLEVESLALKEVIAGGKRLFRGRVGEEGY
jgi:imidazolonepropionase-like amidohydrolase